MSPLNTPTPQHLKTSSVFSSLFGVFSTRRRVLTAFMVVLWIGCLAALQAMRVDEDIRSMIPEEPSEMARHFRFLQESPLSGKLLIEVSAEQGGSTGALVRAVDRLAGSMKPPLFSRVLTGPPVDRGEGMPDFLIQALPSLFTEKDRSRSLELLAPDRVRARLEHILRSLATLQGWGSRKMETRDPLGLRLLALEKMRSVSPIPDVRIQEGHFVSRDGRHALIVAETPVPMTDPEGGKRLLEAFHGLTRELPSSVEASLYSGHLYSVANAETVRRDLFLVLSLSSGALVLLFLVFVRSINGLLILLVPATTLLAAMAGTSLVYDPVSAVTLGFGAVLLGISIDFGIHVYFALRGSGRDRAAAVTGRVGVPVLFAGLTSMAAFSVLLFSTIPAQRQLGVFSLIGMTSALVISLVALPQWIRPVQAHSRRSSIPVASRPRWVVWVWAGFLVFMGWKAASLEFQGDLRKMSRVPTEVRELEERLTRNWGGLLGRALVVTEGEDLMSVLPVNDRVFEELENLVQRPDIMSLAPLLPSPEKQEENRKRWRAFWSESRVQQVRTVLKDTGEDLGFSQGAFTPFFQWLDSDVHSIGPEDLVAAGLEEIMGGFVLRTPDRVRVLSLVPDSPDLRPHLMEVFRNMPQVSVISPSAFGDRLSLALGRDFLFFILGAGGMVLVLVGMLLRSAVRMGAALVPVCTGLVVAMGGMAVLGIPLNVFSMVAAVLIIGLGVDYGVFMVMRRAGEEGLGTEKAVLVSGLTTLAGFGALALALHPALHTIGVTVLLGIGAAFPSALLVIPAFQGKLWE
ncbi:MAG: MMPL family transporter [Desulfobacteraceae bacterium]|jgi:predicted exporter